MSKPVTVRLADELVAAVEQIAATEDRTVSQVIGRLIESGLQNRTTVSAPIPIMITTKEEALQVPRALKAAREPEEDDDWSASPAPAPRPVKERKYVKPTRDNLPGPRPVAAEQEKPRRSSGCPHGGIPASCIACKKASRVGAVPGDRPSSLAR